MYVDMYVCIYVGMYAFTDRTIPHLPLLFMPFIGLP